MTPERSVADIPATERAIVGLCHGLNDQLAAINAYAFLLKRRGVLDDADAPLQEHLDRLAEKVRLVRSLCRDPKPEVGPVALTLLTEAATQIMDGYPDGSVVFHPRRDGDGAVLRCDWTRALRAMLLAGAWVSRGVDVPVSVEVAVENRDGLSFKADADVPPPPDEEERPDPACEPIRMTPTGGRSVSIGFSDG